MFAEECPFKVVRTNGGDEVLAQAANLLIGRAAFGGSAPACNPIELGRTEIPLNGNVEQPMVAALSHIFRGRFSHAVYD